LKKEVKECPQCGRAVECLTDQEELRMRKGDLEVVTVEGEEPCGKCEEGVKNREERL
jgi:hypothetical protein